jgi:hypothetical protein
MRALEEAEACAREERWEELERVLPGLEKQMEEAVGMMG